jgi:hypothetical protein
VDNLRQRVGAMRDNDSSIMELWCIERAKTDRHNRGKWLAQAERWHELTRARSSWQLPKTPFQHSVHTKPIITQPPQQG